MVAQRFVMPISLATVAALALLVASCGDPTHAADQTPKDTTKPATTETPKPETKQPENAKPDATKPDAAKADTTKPDTTKPQTASPEKPATPDPMTTPANPTLPIENVTISGKTFKLELANTDETRFHGLSGRTTIPADGGMLFVFPARGVKRHGFLMRDCPVAIDIIYLDPSGRIVGMHKMVPEPARTDDEKVLTLSSGAPAWSASNAAYEARLKQYKSSWPSQFVIELAGNTLDSLNLKDGQKIELDMDRLKKLAK